MVDKKQKYDFTAIGQAIKEAHLNVLGEKDYIVLEATAKALKQIKEKETFYTK